MPAIQKVAIFEPPLVPDRAQAAAILERFDDEMARGKVAAAMMTAMRGAEMGPAWFRALPKALTARLVGMGMAQEAKRPTGPYPTIRVLASTLHADFAVVAGSRAARRLPSIRCRSSHGWQQEPGIPQAGARRPRAFCPARGGSGSRADHAASWV
jgi:hypothetical protein